MELSAKPEAEWSTFLLTRGGAPGRGPQAAKCPKSRGEAQRSGFDAKKEEGSYGYEAFGKAGSGME